MMALLLQREYFPYRSTKIQQNYKETLQKLQEIDVAKVVKMDIFHSIFKNRYKIGELENSMTLREDGTYDLYNKCKFSVRIHKSSIWKQLADMFNVFDIEGKQKLDIELSTELHIGMDYQIKEIYFYLQSNIFNITCTGTTDGNKINLHLEKDKEKTQYSFVLPPGAMLNNMIGGIQENYPTLSVGKQIEAQWFDPISQKVSKTISTVKTKIDFEWNNKKVPVYIIHTDTGRFKTTAWVNEAGEVLQYQFFLFYLVRVPDQITNLNYTENQQIDTENQQIDIKNKLNKKENKDKPNKKENKKG